MSATIETLDLLAEIRRYLAAVELFRALGCEPTWRPELGTSVPVAESGSNSESHIPSAH